MNNNTTTHADDTNISLHLPPDPPYRGFYEGYKFMKIKTIESLQPYYKIINIKHQGFALTLMSREVLEHIGFRDSKGCCPDSCFSLDLHNAGIRQYCHLKVRCKHLKVDDKTQLELLQVGKKPACIELK